jgi:hypothetical protein
VIKNSDCIKILSHKTSNLLKNLKLNIKGIDKLLSKKLNIEVFRKKVLYYQDLCNYKNCVSKILNDIKDDLFLFLNSKEILVQSFAYLRVSRPLSNIVKKNMDNINFHRESFYGDNLDKVINIWTPICGSTTERTLLYVPGSHKIPSSKITLINEDDPYTKPKSAGHKIGLLHRTKKIVGGVDLDKSIPMYVPFCHSAIFDGNLIHGPSENFGKDLRVSIDFKVLRKENYRNTCQNKHHYSKKPYFIEYF